MTTEEFLGMSYEEFCKFYDNYKVPIDPTYKDKPQSNDFWEFLKQGTQKLSQDDKIIDCLREVSL